MAAAILDPTYLLIQQARTTPAVAKNQTLAHRKKTVFYSAISSDKTEKINFVVVVDRFVRALLLLLLLLL
jgi:hypothetical protein